MSSQVEVALSIMQLMDVDHQDLALHSHDDDLEDHEAFAIEEGVTVVCEPL